jgi:transposase InsO family protein
LNDQSPGTCHYTILQRSGTLPGGGCKLLKIPREVKPDAIPTHQVSIRMDHVREFDNEVQFGKYCDLNRISHNFSAPRTPQSNGLVERKNRSLQEMSRTMLNEQYIPQNVW